ncbi:MAG: HIT domain-containing protein, partial [Candidatus Methanomethylicia archaeon]|nr:HIT domain-containing protein [Candidatus Methanomethylicia archaeon]
YRHIGDLNKLKKEEISELFIITSNMVEILKKTYKIDGCNIGINIGKAAGAGIPQHIHVHIIPRWFGDTNFMLTVGNVKVIPESLQHTYKILLKEVNTL